MPVDERARHRLYLKLEEVLGPDEAGILMDHLPPTGFGDLPTKGDLHVLRSDLQQLRAATKSDFERFQEKVTTRMEGLEHRLTAPMESLARRLVMWTSAMVLATGGLAFAAGRFV